MEIIRTNKERNIRYLAFEKHGVVFEHSEPEHTGGFELFYYMNQYPNEDIPNSNYISISVSIISYQGKSFLLNSYVESKDKFRLQKGINKIYDTYEEAKENAFKEIDRLEKWITSSYWLELPLINITKQQWKDLEQYNKKIMTDGTKCIKIINNAIKRYKYNISENLLNYEVFRVNII